MLAAMLGNDYWVSISCSGRRLGAGLQLTRCYVLTAFHCVRGAADEAAVLDITFASGQRAEGRVHRVRPDADLALIDVPGAPVNFDFRVDLARIGQDWYDPYRPDRDDVYLTGEVSAVPIRYQCAAGSDIEAIQLACSQLLGDYSGYSGSPVTRAYPDGRHAVIGILIEQYMERVADTWRASNVLIATSVAEASRSFDCLDVGHLLSVLYPAASPASPAEPAPRPTEAQAGWLARVRRRHLQADVVRLNAGIQSDRRVLDVLDEVRRRGQIDEQAIHQLTLDVLRRLAGRGLVEGS